VLPFRKACDNGAHSADAPPRPVAATVTPEATAPSCLERRPQVLLVDLVPESLDSVDLDERYPGAIPPLELGIDADIDDLEVASTDASHGVDGRRAQVAAGSGVDDHARHPEVSEQGRPRRVPDG